MSPPNSDLLAEDNLCGGTLLRIASRGSAIIAELLRLSSNIPPVFTQSSSTSSSSSSSAAKAEASSSEEGSEYSGLLFEFDYFKRPEDYESIVNKTDSLSGAGEKCSEG